MTCIGLFVLVQVGVRRRMSAEVVHNPSLHRGGSVAAHIPPFPRTLSTPFVHKKINETLFFCFFLDQGSSRSFLSLPVYPLPVPQATRGAHHG